MKARIYQPAKTAMQSGRAKMKRWVLEFEPSDAHYVEPLMGWVGQRDTQQQLSLSFETKEQAEDYAQERGIDYHLIEPQTRHVRPKSYANNFRFDQVRKRS
ncbi:MAG: ETC complex I subunit [Sphaerospermopsis sp. SIO1G2]|nr:ETC complex I subunit [Sphaerospermopsis sp. SIO1G2]